MYECIRIFCPFSEIEITFNSQKYNHIKKEKKKLNYTSLLISNFLTRLNKEIGFYYLLENNIFYLKMKNYIKIN